MSVLTGVRIKWVSVEPGSTVVVVGNAFNAKYYLKICKLICKMVSDDLDLLCLSYSQ